MTSLRWGLLGTARINRAIITAIRASSRNRLAAVASRTIDAARAHAAEWQIPSALSPYQALLDDPSIDAVYIGLPNTLHTEWSIRAMEAGKHVLCEKPLALTVADVDRIAEAARRTGRLAAEAFMYRHHPLTHAAVAAIREGRIGQLRFLKGAFTYQLTGRNPDIRVDPGLGGGSLWDVGCYPVSFSCLLADAMPHEVFGWQSDEGAGVDLTFAGSLRFGTDLFAQFDSGFRTVFRAEMEAVGTEGTLRIERPFKAMPESRLLLVRGESAEPLPFRPDEPYIGEIEDFAAAVLDGTPHPLPLTESRRTVQVLTALYESARINAPVRVTPA